MNCILEVTKELKYKYLVEIVIDVAVLVNSQ